MVIVADETNNKVIDFLKLIEDKHQQLYGIVFYLSKLQERNRSEFQIKIAINVINDFLKKSAHEKLFILPNNDIIVTLENRSWDILEKIIYQLRYLFAEDPLSFDKGKENSNFCSVFVLKFQWKEFVDHCYEKINHKPAITSAIQTEQTLSTSTDNSIISFSKIDHDLSTIEFTPFVRNQDMVLFPEPNVALKLYNKIVVSIPYIKHHLNYDQRFDQNRLFNIYLNEKLDEYLLKILEENFDHIQDSPLNINLSIKTVIADHFLDINNFLQKHPNFPVIIDFSISDVFNDVKLFHYVQKYLKSLNYILCLDNVDHYAFTTINREELGFDLIKLKWDPDLPIEIDQDKIESAIYRHSASRVILSECEDSEGLAYAHKVGIKMVCGRIAEQVLKIEG